MARWQLAAIGGAVALVILVVSGFLVFESGGKSSSSESNIFNTDPPPVTGSFGHAKLAGKALGGPYQRTIVIDAKDRRTGRPLHRAEVTVHGEMTVPHAMTLYTKKLREVSRGEYKGPYTLIMNGDWRIVVIATTPKGDTSTSSFPVHVAG
jgi:hypothetical protein